MKSISKLKALPLAGLVVTAMVGLSSCGKESNVVNIWGPAEHEEVYLQAAAKYKEAHPEFDAEVKFSALGDAGANGNISKDVEAAGEIFTFPNDQLIDIDLMGALSPIQGERLTRVQAEHVSGAVEAGKFGGKYLAYPITADNGFVFIFNKDAFKDTAIWDAANDKLVDGYTFRDLYAALDERGAQAGHEKWGAAKVVWPAGTAWYQCGMYFGVGADYEVSFDEETGKQTKSSCNFAYDMVDGRRDFKRGEDAIRCMVNSYTNEDGSINEHFDFLDDSNYNTYANTYSKEGEEKLLAGIVCWNNGNLKTNWGENYACQSLPMLEAKCAQYGGDGTKYMWKTFNGYKLLGVNPWSKYARKSEESLAQLHDFAEYLAGYDVSMMRFNATNAGPSNLQAQADPVVAANPFIKALNDECARVDENGKPGFRVQDCVPQNFWTPIANLGLGVFNYVDKGTNPGQYKNVQALDNELYNLQKSIETTA